MSLNGLIRNQCKYADRLNMDYTGLKKTKQRSDFINYKMQIASSKYYNPNQNST